MLRLIDVLVARDGLTIDEAKTTAKNAKEEIMSLIEAGDFMAADDYLMDEFGLEPDYLDQLLSL